jgi:hypothetical protein
MADVPVVEPAASGEGSANMPDRSVLDQVLSPDKPESAAPVTVDPGLCPNCANNGNQNKLNDFVCGSCGFELPVYSRSQVETK